MEVPPAGIVGALIGAGIGYLDYRIVVGVVEGKLRKLDRSETVAERDVFEGKIRILRLVVLAMTVGAFPIIGFWVGASLGGGG